MTDVKVKVTLTYKGQKVSASEKGVRLTNDEVQISASNLAYGLVEDAWGLVTEDEDD